LQKPRCLIEEIAAKESRTAGRKGFLPACGIFKRTLIFFGRATFGGGFWDAISQRDTASRHHFFHRFAYHFDLKAIIAFDKFDLATFFFHFIHLLSKCLSLYLYMRI
jgi:hypothetical protein